jgi:CDP-diglyceride synthetase
LNPVFAAAKFLFKFFRFYTSFFVPYFHHQHFCEYRGPCCRLVLYILFSFKYLFFLTFFCSSTYFVTAAHSFLCAGFLCSGLKRACNKKNFGALIPGHGGVLDRYGNTLE